MGEHWINTRERHLALAAITLRAKAFGETAQTIMKGNAR